MQSNERVSQLPERLQQLLKVKPTNSQNENKKVKSDTYFTTKRGKGMDSKEADRKTIIDIIADMQEREKEGYVQCLNIEKEATKRGISKPTFYRRLGELTQEGILDKKDVSHKDIRYRVSFRHMPVEQARVLLFKRHALMKINQHLDSVAKTSDEQEIMKELLKWTSALSLYTLLWQIKTGYQYTEAVTYYLSQPGGAPKYLRQMVVFKSGVIIDPLKDTGKLAKLLTDEPLGVEPYNQKLCDLFGIAAKFHGLEFDDFDLIMEALEKGHLTEESIETPSVITRSFGKGRGSFEDAEAQKEREAKLERVRKKYEGQTYVHPKDGPSNLKRYADSQESGDQEKTEE